MMLFCKNYKGLFLFAEAIRKLDAGDSWNMILPIGTFYTKKYGKVSITNEEARALVRNWEARAMGEREPFVDTEHDLGPANGWIKALQIREAHNGDGPGVWALVDWTDRGRDLVEQRIYKYLSAMFGPHQKVETGEIVKPVLLAVSLTNTPLMETMPAVSL